MDEVGSGYLFVTASTADHKLVNRFLLDLRDYCEYGSVDHFNLIRARTLEECDLHDDRCTATLTLPGDIAEATENAWIGANIKEVEDFLKQTARILNDKDEKEERMRRGGCGLFVLLDDEGVRTRTCVVAEMYTDTDSDDGWDFDWMKVRVLWKDAEPIWVNLHIGNMGLVEDFCDWRAGPDKDGWFQRKSGDEELAYELEGLNEEAKKKALVESEDEAEAEARVRAIEDEKRAVDAKILERGGKI